MEKLEKATLQTTSRALKQINAINETPLNELDARQRTEKAFLAAASLAILVGTTVTGEE